MEMMMEPVSSMMLTTAIIIQNTEETIPALIHSPEPPA